MSLKLHFSHHGDTLFKIKVVPLQQFGGEIPDDDALAIISHLTKSLGNSIGNKDGMISMQGWPVLAHLDCCLAMRHAMAWCILIKQSEVSIRGRL